MQKTAMGRSRRTPLLGLILGLIVLLITTGCGSSDSDLDQGTDAAEPADTGHTGDAGADSEAEPLAEEKPKEMEEVNLALSSAIGASWAAVAVAEKEGFFAEEGLKVNVQFPGGSGDVLQAMAVGRTDIGAPTPEAALAAMAQGQDVAMVYRWTRGPVQAYAVKADTEFEDVGDFEGITIGVSSLASGSKTLADAVLRLYGLDPETQVEYLAVGTGVAALDALQRDRVAVLALWDTEYAQMDARGANLRYIRPDEIEDLFSTTFVSSRAWLGENRDAMEGFGRAWAKATVWANENPEGAVRTVWELYPETQTDDTEELLDLHVTIFKGRNEVVVLGDPESSRTWGQYDPKGVQAWIDFAHQNGVTEEPVPLEDAYTNDYVEGYNDFDPAEVREQAAAAKG